MEEIIKKYSWDKRFYKEGEEPIHYLNTLSKALNEAATIANNFKQELETQGLNYGVAWGYIPGPAEYIEVWVCLVNKDNE